VRAFAAPHEETVAPDRKAAIPFLARKREFRPDDFLGIGGEEAEKAKKDPPH
jgi:hypothetical protein